MKGRGVLLGVLISVVVLLIAIYLGAGGILSSSHPRGSQMAGRVTKIDSNNITLLMGRLVAPSEESYSFHKNIVAANKIEEEKGYKEKNRIDENHNTYFIEAEDTVALTINDEWRICEKSGRDVREATLMDISKDDILVIEFGNNDEIEKIIIMEDIN